MSIYSNPVINTIDIPWKIFVTNSNEQDIEKSTKQFVSELNFSEDEAKNAYEEIVIENEKNKINVTKCEGKQNVNSNVSTKIPYKTATVNLIMRAVEQRDLNFLKNHVHSENVNNTDNFGWTPLMLAAYCGFVDIVDFLLKSGANKKFREKSGLTAAQLALKKNYLDIVALLRKNSSESSNSVNIEDLNINTHKKEEIDTNEMKETEFYCEVCKDKFKSKNHESSILHLFNVKSKLPSAFFGISKANKGYQMLVSSGWDEETGLGIDGKGHKYPVKTVLKLDRKGFGLSTKIESRITHFKAGDINAVKSVKPKLYQPKVATKKDREKLLNREARKERALRIALS